MSLLRFFFLIKYKILHIHILYFEIWIYVPLFKKKIDIGYILERNTVFQINDKNVYESYVFLDYK